jgi:ubiquinone/menaquinone biosynthesis C-methylase UbiE
LICDVGTGPGHVARYLHERGVKVCGIDLSPEMVIRARRLNPGMEFQCGDMLALDLADNAFAAMTAFYSVVNMPRDKMSVALREMHRVLEPNGLLLLAFHLGDEMLHRDELWGVEISLDFYFFTVEEMSGYLRSAGFDLREVIERDPYPEVEHQSRRAYIFARKHGKRSDGSRGAKIKLIRS